mmetsp:Transcript_26484/g.67336  ORF Transcript_26484/g.67336 Transcript_26484/m.67336 type:complete len:817 (-) Transcript_26484:272-2722(-)|eukprot:CAMPEP_0202859418 /NCGR_PEP_ID=MMETSP1391-20130828/1540_1 /ASSEMBLY_ACC=CAM_ASM_000867 /TAXON_ID=1034604 /ORGANISM="Chlamydomonas leiostraca, Strain SAG 11-49" /LENGTH=816 /DNA_ID=CAMNT_0049538451 /DNA_START=142 /DNA_END=2592 /DNA_ORIENTATION=+
MATVRGHAPLASQAANRSYNVASVWEQTAALNESQLQAIDTLSQSCTQRPYPTHVVEDQRFTADTAESHTKDAYVGTLEDAVLHNTNQFHKWHTELEAACASEMEEKYKRYADLLNNHLKLCEGILGKVDQTIEYFDTLLTQHRDVSQKSKALYNSCEQLVKEKDQLVEFADAIRTKLKFFDEFETVYAQFQKAQLSLDNDQFLQLLKKLDDCMAYVATNPQYADAGTYTTKFRQLQARALGAVRSKVQQVMKHAVVQVQAAIQEAVPKPAGQTAASAAAAAQQVPVLAEGTEVSLLYVRFRAAAEPNLKGLVKEVESRTSRPEYMRLLEECIALYAAARQQLVSPFLSQRLHQEQAAQPLPAFTRAGCEHLLRVCQMEAQLFEQFFPSLGKSAPEHLAPLTEPLCTLLYDALRPPIITLQDIDELCELVDILKHEVLGEQVGRRGGGAEALRPMLTRTLADVQARLIYRCQAFIKDEVAGYSPSAADVDYPAKLERAAIEAAEAASTSAAAAPGDSNGHSAAAEANGAAAAAPAAASPYAALYPPLRSTLLCLSKLYRAVDGRTFGGLAQEAVAACTSSVQQASRQVARKAGPLDAQLFMIKHLLFLREQIAPFDVDFAATDIDLDFTHMRDHLRRILAGESSLFTLSSNNAVVKMLGTGGPRVLTYQVDSKKELEKALKGVCEAFIMAVTKVAVEPMLSFITKVTAVRVAAQANAATAKPLREQAFAVPAKVAEMVGKVNEALAGPLPAAIKKMSTYLPNPATHAILFKPVKSNIAEAHGQVAALLAAEYAPEEAAGVQLYQPHQLAALLDAMC